MLPGIGNRVRRLRATRGRTMSDPAYQQEMATTCPPAAVINLLFKTWLRVRQVYDPNAWDVGEEAKKRKRQEEEHGAEEPVWFRESAFNIVLLPVTMLEWFLRYEITFSAPSNYPPM